MSYLKEHYRNFSNDSLEKEYAVISNEIASRQRQKLSGRKESRQNKFDESTEKLFERLYAIQSFFKEETEDLTVGKLKEISIYEILVLASRQTSKENELILRQYAEIRQKAEQKNRDK